MAGMAEINELIWDLNAVERLVPSRFPSDAAIAHPSPITSWKAQERSPSTLAASSTRLRLAATFCSQATSGSGFSVACSSSRPLNPAPCKTHRSPPVRLWWSGLRACAGLGGCAVRPRGRAPA